MAAEKGSKMAKAGEKASPGKYVCIDCGYEFELSAVEKDLKKCPMCACEEYNCYPMTHIRPDVKTPEDAKSPPKKRDYMK
ncbi:MAG: zinc ribbon-containing protein [Methanomicrobiales archaeon]|nr:zinc ribbon-containing protein [Methanomicrobiales archaeon]